VGLIGGAAAFALAVERRTGVLILDLAATAPAAPAIAAVADAAPEVAAAEPSLPAPPVATETAPVVPDVVHNPVHAAAPMALPRIAPPVAAELSLPRAETEPEASTETVRPKPRPEAKPVPDPERGATHKSQTTKEKPPKEARSKEPVRSEKPVSSPSAPRAAAKAKGGEVSPAAYARAVMKKVRATRLKAGAGKGTVVVGFTIAPDGSLASVQVLHSSGDVALDAVAVDHIRRSAPFPAPAPNEKPRFSFEFVGK
jgi:protein TonB